MAHRVLALNAMANDEPSDIALALRSGPSQLTGQPQKNTQSVSWKWRSWGFWGDSKSDIRVS